MTTGLRIALFVSADAVLGFGDYRLVGCRTGLCPITANPYISTLYEAVVGFLLSIFR